MITSGLWNLWDWRIQLNPSRHLEPNAHDVLIKEIMSILSCKGHDVAKGGHNMESQL